MKIAAALIIVSTFLISCKKDNDEMDTSAHTMNNISYGSSAQQKMDIYLPANRSSATKTFVLIHGGSWMGGDKQDMAGFVEELKIRFPDHAFVNINYRLASGGNTHLFPTQELDVKAAIDFYLSKSSEYNVSQRLILFGVSAGGHLALLHGYKNDQAGHVEAIIDAFGPTDLPAMYSSNSNTQLALALVTGATPTSNPEIYNQSSPIQYVNAQSPPTIVLQGGADTTVDPAQSTSLISVLQQAGVINQLVYYPSEGHGWGGANLIDSFNKMETFVRANVN